MATTKKSEIKREELLDRGVALMWERGFNGVSVRDIVQAAGVPKGSFYFYFDSKDDFALEALKKYVRISAEMMPQNVDEELKSPLARLRRIYEMRACAVGKDDCRNGCMLVNVANELGAQNDGLREYIDAHWNKMQEPIAELVGEAISKGEISDRFEATQLAGFLEMSWMGAVTVAKASRDTAGLKASVDFMFDKVLA